MGLFDMLFGNDKTSPQQQHGQSADDQAVARYRYMLKTAPPETVEEAHAEAFARLTSEQRSLVLQSLSESVPSAERTQSTDPNALARLATRAEMRQPGTMERTLGRAGGGVGLGGLMAGSLLSTIAGTVIGSMIAQQFFANDAQAPEETGGSDSAEGGDDHAADDTSSDFDSGDFDI
ncbi:MAG: hypothetical protein ACREV1_07630 [Gammaproteobacteria bacterium]